MIRLIRRYSGVAMSLAFPWAHCLNKTVTQRKWLPQIKCSQNQGGDRVGGGISKIAKQ